MHLNKKLTVNLGIYGMPLTSGIVAHKKPKQNWLKVMLVPNGTLHVKFIIPRAKLTKQNCKAL